MEALLHLGKYTPVTAAEILTAGRGGLWSRVHANLIKDQDLRTQQLADALAHAQQIEWMVTRPAEHSDLGPNPARPRTCRAHDASFRAWLHEAKSHPRAHVIHKQALLLRHQWQTGTAPPLHQLFSHPEAREAACTVFWTLFSGIPQTRSRAVQKKKKKVAASSFAPPVPGGHRAAAKRVRALVQGSSRHRGVSKSRKVAPPKSTGADASTPAPGAT